jgi:hypothetical protein
MHEDELEKAKALAGVNEVTDAIFLIRKYRSKNNKEKPEKAEKQKEKNTSKESQKDTNNEHELIKLFNRMRDSGNTIKISMVNGESYYVSVKSYFLKMTSCDGQNLVGFTNGEIKVNELAIDDAIRKGGITVLPKTKIEYFENYMILTGCDDEYSPNLISDDTPHYVHQFEKVAINMNNVASLSIVKDFDFGANEIIKADVLVKYLLKKML